MTGYVSYCICEHIQVYILIWCKCAHSEYICCVIWTVFYICLSKVAVNESIGYMCKVFCLFAETLPEMENRWWFWHLIYNWLMFLHNLISNTICITQPNNNIALHWVIHTFAESMYKVVPMLTSFTCAGVPFHTHFTIRHFTFSRLREEIKRYCFKNAHRCYHEHLV